MIELFANDSGRFIKGYCDRMITKAELAAETNISLRDLRSITESSQRRRRIATLITRPNAMIFHMDVRLISIIIVSLNFAFQQSSHDFSRSSPLL